MSCLTRGRCLEPVSDTRHIKLISVIETSSHCNLSCSYCPCTTAQYKRSTGIMNMRTFIKAIGWVRYYVAQGAYKYGPSTLIDINLHGIGEPLLNPLIVDMVKFATSRVPDVKFRLCTNGKALTRDLCSKLSQAGLYSLDITDHDAATTARVLEFREDYFPRGNIARGFSTLPHTWAGQVGWYKSKENTRCVNQDHGLAVVLWDGQVTTCCLDAFNTNVFGHVDEDITKLEFKPLALCKTCHYQA